MTINKFSTKIFNMDKSRQEKWQNIKQSKGLCTDCGAKPLAKKSKWYCELCLLKRRYRAKKWLLEKKNKAAYDENWEQKLDRERDEQGID